MNTAAQGSRDEHNFMSQRFGSLCGLCGREASKHKPLSDTEEIKDGSHPHDGYSYSGCNCVCCLNVRALHEVRTQILKKVNEYFTLTEDPYHARWTLEGIRMALDEIAEEEVAEDSEIEWKEKE
jgi:hypothetical protein